MFARGDKVRRVSNGAPGEVVNPATDGDMMVQVRFVGCTASIPLADLALDDGTDFGGQPWPPDNMEVK